MGFLKNLAAKMAGKRIAKELKLEENMDSEKKWYKSKTVLSAIVAVLIAVYNSVGESLAPVVGWTLPPIPDWVFAFLGALGVYGRVSASATITK